MPKAYFFNLPLHGHVNPSLSLVKRLIENGHEIHYFSGDSFKDKIEATGAIYHPYPGPMEALKGFESGNWIDALDGLYSFMDDQLNQLLEQCQKDPANYLIYDFMCPWGKVLRSHLGLPAVSLFATFMLRPELLPWMSGTLFQLPKHIAKRKRLALKTIARGFKSKRDFGISIPMLSALANEGDCNFIYTSRELHPGGKYIRNPGFHFLGNHNDHDTSNFCNSYRKGDKPYIYASLGTLYHHNQQFFQNVVQAFSDKPQFQVVISLGGEQNSSLRGTQIPDHIRVESFVPQIGILKECDVFITHSGMNSVSESIIAGTPMVLVPQQQEQWVIADRIAKLGAGIRMRQTAPSSTQILHACESILQNERYSLKADSMGKGLQECLSVDSAVAKINQAIKVNVSKNPLGNTHRMPKGRGFEIFRKSSLSDKNHHAD